MKQVVVNHLHVVTLHFIVFSPQEMLGEAEMAAAKKLSENEARVTELTDRWKDRWKETQKILEVWTITGCIILIIVIDNKSSYS